MSRGITFSKFRRIMGEEGRVKGKWTVSLPLLKSGGGRLGG